MKKTDIYKARAILATFMGYTHSKMHPKKPAYHRTARYLLPGSKTKYILLEYLDFEMNFNLLMQVKRKIEQDQRRYYVAICYEKAYLLSADDHATFMKSDEASLNKSLFTVMHKFIVWHNKEILRRIFGDSESLKKQAKRLTKE